MWQITILEGRLVTRVVLGNEKCARDALVKLHRAGVWATLRPVNKLPERTAAEAARVDSYTRLLADRAA